MISANELRIGNYFKCRIEVDGDEKILSVKAILPGHILHEIMLDDIGRLRTNVAAISFHDLMPIPLTTTILEKYGFVKFAKSKDYICADENHSLDFVELEDWTVYCIDSPVFYVGIKQGAFFHVEDAIASNEISYIYKIGIELKYLHDLQNRFHSITGYELKIDK